MKSDQGIQINITFDCFDFLAVDASYFGYFVLLGMNNCMVFEGGGLIVEVQMLQLCHMSSFLPPPQKTTKYFYDVSDVVSRHCSSVLQVLSRQYSPSTNISQEGTELSTSKYT